MGYLCVSVVVTSTHAADVQFSFGFCCYNYEILLSYKTSIIITDKSSVSDENDGGVPGAYYISGVLFYLQ